MNRTTRSLSLTEAGERYFHFCEETLARIDQMDADISAEAMQAKGELSFLAPKWMHETMTRAFAAFVRRYPEIQPKLVLGGMAQTAYDFIEQGCEMALHTRRIPDSRIVARKLAELPYVICATPGYLAQSGPVSTPAELAAHRGLIQYSYPVWALDKERRKERLQLRPILSSNTYMSLRVAALEGLGPTYLPLCLVRDDLAEGRLVRILPDWETEGQTVYVSAAPGGGTPSRVRLMMEFLPAWLKENPL